MKTHSIVVTLFALLLGGGTPLLAGQSFKLETEVYVFRHVDFHAVQFSAEAAHQEVHGATLQSPATAQFDHETLSLDGPSFSWSGGHNPPDRFSLIAAPAVPLVPGQPVTLLSAMRVQYLEKQADGSLKVHEYPSDSPDAPHCRLTFTLAAADKTDLSFRLACHIDVATVSRREGLSGVALDVGKPVLARFAETLDVTMRPNNWSALLLRSPNGSDYSLLLLLKLTPEARPGDAAAVTRDDNRSMTTGELDRFATYYYLDPQPDRIPAAINALGPSGFLEHRATAYLGFFAGVFAANPDRIAEWKRVILRQYDPARSQLLKALKLSGSPDSLKKYEETLAANDQYWGAFFATGDPAYVREVIGQLKCFDETDDANRFAVGAIALWSLAFHGPHHPLVRSTLQAAEATANPGVRELIAELLSKDQRAIRAKIAKVHRDRKFYAERPGPDLRDPFYRANQFFESMAPRPAAANN